MKRIKIYASIFLMVCLSVSSCKDDLIEMNVNPNGADPNTTNPNLVLSTVLTETGKAFVNLGYQDIAGVMQHTQKDGWANTHNNYDWDRNNSWNNYYYILRNNNFVSERSLEMGLEFHQGVSLIIKSMMFGLITDLWGDVPYTNALKGSSGVTEGFYPTFDSQEFIYDSILEDLEQANQLLSKPANSYTGISTTADVYYVGNVARWRQLANSLKLRYYMRISDKKPNEAKAGIETIMADPTQYPIITNPAHDATMGFAGVSNDTSWPSNTVYDASGSNYRRLKMCATLVEVMREREDPRLGVWANRVQIPLYLDESLDGNISEVSNGVRILSSDYLSSRGLTEDDINQNSDFVGIPPSILGPQGYNLSTDASQASNNPHVSWLNDRYKNASGSLLRARLMSASEVRFILAEAALKGWAVGSAEDHYNAAIQASFTTWGVEGNAGTYLTNANVAFEGTLKQIIEQKWIASWTAATEAWFDYRRTGYPELTAGPIAIREVLPIRFYYPINEQNLNGENVTRASERLEITSFAEIDGNNSAWSKPWVLQNTGKPW
ncbi:MAG: SusD/RagB family nutrient-binding outer membrane lipoprotein [Cyclobacteriaceae bacterium]